MEFEPLLTRRYDVADNHKIGIAEANRYAGRVEQALAILDNIFGPAEQTADYMYQRAATVAAVGGRMDEALALYQRCGFRPYRQEHRVIDDPRLIGLIPA